MSDTYVTAISFYTSDSTEIAPAGKGKQLSLSRLLSTNLTKHWPLCKPHPRAQYRLPETNLRMIKAFFTRRDGLLTVHLLPQSDLQGKSRCSGA